MPTFSRFFSRTAFALALLAGAAAPAHAFDPSATFAENEEPREILRYGFEALRAGKMDDAMGAFRFGAEKNDVLAQWKLARMMQAGEHGAPDHAAAVELFRKIANRHGDQTPTAADKPYVSAAVVTLGLYELHGIEGSGVVANPWRAETYFFRAAALYHDPEAQYHLGSLHRSDLLGDAEPRLAARWLSLSARKGHPWAQAELGEMLIAGEGVPSRPVRGLVMLARAAETAGEVDPLIAKLNGQAWDAASAEQRKSADAVLNATRTAGPQPYAGRRMAHSMGFPRFAAAQGQ